MTESTRAWYLRAARELAGTSPRQVEWCRAVADDACLLARLDSLPRPARQPSLLFAVAAWLGAPDAGAAEWTAWVLSRFDEVAAELPRRRVQTNEPARSIPVRVALGRIPGPIALIELGASAGLCLLVDDYRYRFRAPDGVHEQGTGGPVLEATVDARELVPAALPDIAWRAGIDLAPLDVRDPGHRRWLAASLPPDHPGRRERLAAALATAAAHPPRVVAGDALTALPALAAEAPAEATLVVASLGTAVYLPPADRERLLPLCTELGARAITFEARAAIPAVRDRWAALAADGRVDPAAGFVLALDGEPIAEGAPHGDRLLAVRTAVLPGAEESRAYDGGSPGVDPGSRGGGG
ncbi:DUF2332 family protein [Protaetiibacter larvae]|nr:DUF2332 family protein [Protaetiibacter larvae]